MELNYCGTEFKGTFLSIVSLFGLILLIPVNWLIGLKLVCGWMLEIVKRSDDIKGFKDTFLTRWIVERTFGWLGRYRRLSKDYEGLTESSQAFIYAAMIHIMIRRLARIKTSSG